jgi:hypothetical protein
MSPQETTDAMGRIEVGETPSQSLSRLAELARQAYEQKRSKDCLDFTRAVLLIDPDNADAQWMRSSIQSELHQDLENAREFIRQAQSREQADEPSLSAGQPVPEALDANSDGGDVKGPRTVASQPFHANSRRRLATRLLMGAAVLVVLSLIGVTLPRFTPRSKPVEASRLTSNAPDTERLNQADSINADEPILSPPAPAAQPEAPPASLPRPAYTSVVASTSARLDATLPDDVVPASGTLAISSSTSVDIFKDDAYIGSTPISLELPAGTHTLEYRHAGLRKYVTHVVNSNETTRAMVTFDVNVQINSRPWAEVFLDGVERKALGQTPLSGVRVPIGSVLIFENPQFQTKRYRVTGNENGIQVVFP